MGGKEDGRQQRERQANDGSAGTGVRAHSETNGSWRPGIPTLVDEVANFREDTITQIHA